MKACENHNNAVVIYDELILRKGCPFCSKQRDFGGLQDDIKELSRIIDAKGLV